MEKEFNHDLFHCEIYRVHILHLLLELASNILTDEKLNKDEILEQLLDLIDTADLNSEFCYRGAVK